MISEKMLSQHFSQKLPADVSVVQINETARGGIAEPAQYRLMWRMELQTASMSTFV